MKQRKHHQGLTPHITDTQTDLTDLTADITRGDVKSAVSSKICLTSDITDTPEGSVRR